MGIFNAAPLRPVADGERSTQVLTAGSAEKMNDDERRLTGGEASGTLKMPLCLTTNDVLTTSGTDERG
jgi:hypothetical protein